MERYDLPLQNPGIPFNGGNSVQSTTPRNAKNLFCAAIRTEEKVSFDYLFDGNGASVSFYDSNTTAKTFTRARGQLVRTKSRGPQIQRPVAPHSRKSV